MNAVHVYLPIPRSNVGGKVFSLAEDNPGVSGSHFPTIQFGILLALRQPGWRVVFLSDARFGLVPYPRNVTIEIAGGSAETCRWLARQPRGIIIWMAMQAHSLERRFWEKLPGRHVVWSRHPFDPMVRRLAAERAKVDIVCVGEHQWFSNYSRRIPVHFIQEVFLGPQCAKTPKIRPLPTDHVAIAHIGSLVPAKGFLEIAMAWSQLKELLPSPRLHVIGGTDLYGWQAGGRLIPTTQDYEREILRYLPEEDIRSGKVMFYGILGAEKFDILRKSHFAIQNPTGLAEAFPASPLEAMSVGLPVIGSDDFGMADCMRHFPELVVHGQRGIAKRAAWMIAEENRYVDLQLRAFRHAVNVRATESAVLDAWERLLNALVHERSVTPALVPHRPFHGSTMKLIYRREIQPRLVRAKRALLRQD